MLADILQNKGERKEGDTMGEKKIKQGSQQCMEKRPLYNSLPYIYSHVTAQQ